MNKLLDKKNLLNIITIIFLIVLPYYLFEGKLFIGGDDTRLQYLYPEIFLEHIAPYSWTRFASVGTGVASQFYLPFLILWVFVKSIINNSTVLNYLAFSSPLIIGFIYFQKFLNELVIEKKHKLEIYAGTLFYLFSPILVYDQLFIFLTPVWLVGLIPIILYYFLRYLKTSKFINVFKALVAGTVFSLVALSVPWILGLFLPILFSFLIAPFLYKKKNIISGFKKFIIFFGLLGLSQAFWLFGYVMSYVGVSSNSFAIKIFTKDFQDTFTPTILATASGNIFYPLLNLFHRQIAFDFVWGLRNIFLNFYDKTFLLNTIFILILFLGLISFKKYANKSERRTYLIFLTSFLISLYFFTVNIGPLKDLFLLFGRLPLFTMFRNFYDKFSLGYVIIYSVVITFSLIFAKRRFKKFKKTSIFITYAFIFVVLFNLIPLKKTINAPIWTTENIYKKIILPKEYLDFMGEIKKTVTPNNIILSLPFGSSTYTIIKDEKSNNIYLGVSPVVIFSGVSDISGYLSFNYSNQANLIDKIIIDRKYTDLDKIIYAHNINYIFVTKNIPAEAKKSYAFSREVLRAQDEKFFNSIAGKKLLTSKEGNYELYTTKKRNSLLKSENLYFQRINPTKFKLYIKNIKEPQSISFLESVHVGWKLYLNEKPDLSFCETAVPFSEYKTIECKEKFKVYDDDISYILRKPIFENSHEIENEFSNKWTIDPEYIKTNFDSNYYKLNKDGSIDVEMDLFFKPQVYFYIGIAVSLTVFIICALYLVWKIKYEKKS